MLAQVKLLLQNVPFEPFTIFTADGKQYRVPTSDHAWIAPDGRICVGEDEGVNLLSPLLVTNVRSDRLPSSMI